MSIIDGSIDARLAGYSWDDVHNHLDQSTDAAKAFGYTQPEIDAHLGLQDPKPLQDHLDQLANDQKAPLEPLPAPTTPDAPPEPVDPRLSIAYANGLQQGFVADPQEFADHVAAATGSTPEAAQHLAANLPHPEEFIDHAIAITHRADNDLTGENIRAATDNLMHLYGQSGMTPQEAHADPDPIQADVLSQPQQPYMPTMAELETYKRDAINKTVNPALALIPGVGQAAMILDPETFIPMVKSLYKLPEEALDFRLETEKMRQEGKDTSERWKDDPGINFLGDTIVALVLGRTAQEGAALTGKVLEHPLIQNIVHDEAGGGPNLVHNMIDRQMAATEKATAASSTYWQAGQYRTGTAWEDQAAALEKAMKGEEPEAPAPEGKTPEPVVSQAKVASAKTPLPPELQAADEELRAAAKGGATWRSTQEKPTRPTKIEDVQKAQDAYNAMHDAARAKEKAENLRQSYVTADEEFRASAEGGAKPAKEKPTRPTSVADLQKAMEERDTAHVEGQYSKADEELRASAEGGATLKSTQEKPTRPTSVADVQKAQEAWEKAHQDALDKIEAAKAKQKEAGLKATWDNAQAELKQAAEGGEKNPLTQKGSESWQKAYDEFEAAHRPRPADPVGDPEQAEWVRAQLEHEADRIGRAPPKEPEPVIEPPAALKRKEVNIVNTELDDELFRLGNRHEANIRRAQVATSKLPPQWQTEEFGKKVQSSLQKRQIDPAHVHNPEVQAYLDASKSWTDKLTELRREHAELTGKDPNLVKTTEEGYVPRVKLGEEKSINGEAEAERNPILRGGGGTGLTRGADSMVDHREYVVEHPDGTRTWGGPDVKDHGFEYGQKVPVEHGYGTVKPATLEEIEKNTGAKFSTNHWANLMHEVVQTQKANSHIKFIEQMKPELEKIGLWSKEKPATDVMNKITMKEVDLPQFKGYAHPKIADTLNAFWDGNRSNLMRFLEKSSRALMRSLFITFMPHVDNVAAHTIVGRGLDWFHPLGYWRLARFGAEAVRNVWTLNDTFLNHVDEGAGMQYLSTQTRNFHRSMMMKAIHEVWQNPTQWTKWLKAVSGLAPFTAIDLASAMYRQVNRALWFGNDVMLEQRILELQDKGSTLGVRALAGKKVAEMVGAKNEAMPLREAIMRAEKDIPNYRIPSQIMGSPAMAEFMKSPVFMNFGRYRYGQLRALALNVHDLLPQNIWNHPADALDAVAKLVLLYYGAQYGYPLVNSTLQQMASKATGGADWAKNLVLKAAGPFSLLHAIGQVKGFAQDQKAFAAAMASFFTWGKAIEIGHMATSNKDVWGKDIINPKATTRGKIAQGAEAVANEIPPLQMLMNLVKPNGLPKTIAQFLGGDVEKPPLDASTQAKYDKRDQAISDARERGDAFENWLNENFGNVLPGSPVAPAGGGGGGGGGSRSSSGGGGGGADTGQRPPSPGGRRERAAFARGINREQGLTDYGAADYAGSPEDYGTPQNFGQSYLARAGRPARSAGRAGRSYGGGARGRYYRRRSI